MRNFEFNFKALDLETLKVYEVVSIQFPNQKVMVKDIKHGNLILKTFDNIKLLEGLNEEMYVGDVYKHDGGTYSFFFRDKWGIKLCYIDKYGNISVHAGDSAKSMLGYNNWRGPTSRKVGHVWDKEHHHLLHRFINPNESRPLDRELNRGVPYGFDIREHLKWI